MIRSAILAGLIIASLAAAWLHWRAAPPSRRRAPLLVCLALGLPLFGASLVMLVVGLVVNPLAPLAYAAWAFAVVGCALLVAALLARVPWARAWPAPLLIAPLILLDGATPFPGILFASILFLVSVTAPPAAAAAWERRGIAVVGAALLGMLLTAGMLFGTLTLLMGVGEGGFVDPAAHRATVSIVPEAAGVYTAYVPLFRAEEPDAQSALDALLASARVVEGNASIALVDGALRVEAEGPVIVAFERAFFGPGREAFVRWTFAEDALRVDGTPVRVVLSFDLSGGTGHTCWMRGERTARIAPGENGAFELEDRPSKVCA